MLPVLNLPRYFSHQHPNCVRWISLLCALLLVAALPAAAHTVVINELQASNSETIADEDNDYPDWIELYNHGSEPVLLDGFGLSDDEDNPFRWVLPDIALEPGQFLLIFASNKDRADGPFLHTNFAISSSGEELLLTAPDGTLIDFVPPTPVPTDTSFGRQPDGAADWFYFEVPTPGTANGEEALGEKLPPPAFSHEGGFYTEPFMLSLTSHEPGATILYTLDGSEPDESHLGGTAYLYKNSFPRAPADPFGPFIEGNYESREYFRPLVIEDRTGQAERLSQRSTTIDRSPNYLPITPVFQGSVVRARTVREGYLPSRVITQTYFVTPEGDARYGIPVISFVVPEHGLFDYEDGIYTAGIDFDEWREGNDEDFGSWRVPANYHRRGIETEKPVHMEYFLPGQGRVWSQNLGLRIHGDSTRVYPQKSLRVYARNAYDDSNTMDFPFCPGLTTRLSGEPRDSFRRLMFRNSGQDYDQSRIRDAFIHILVAPTGVDYQAYEPALHFINGEYWGLINIRERIDPHYIAAHHGVNADEVAIFDNRVTLSAGEDHHWIDLMNLRSYAGAHDLSNPAHFQHMADRMDVDNFLLYNMVQIYIANVDWPAYNRLAWRVGAAGQERGGPHAPDDGRWRWIPYDFDVAFGPWPAHGSDFRHDTLTMAIDHESPITGRNSDWSTVKLRSLLDNEGFRTAFISAFADHMNTTFLPPRVDALVDELFGRIAPYLPEHAQRWRGMGDTSPQFLKDFGRERPAWMRQHIVNYFDLEGTYELTIAMPPEGAARIRVNSIELEADGGEWTGIYFLGVPIEVEVVPKAGFRFAGWEGAFDGEGMLLALNPGTDLAIAPLVFEENIALHEVILPRFMQGMSPNNNDRVPYTCRLRIEGLLPGATYRFANRVVTAEDTPTQNGAGNAIYRGLAKHTHFRTTATPDFAVPGTYGEFTTDANGAYEGWFTIEPSGNPRFGEPEVYIRILLNDGMDGEEYLHFLTTSSPVEVLSFGFGWKDATGIYAESPLAPESAVFLYDNLEGEGRPLSGTLVKPVGLEPDPRYATFYKQFVKGRSGAFGTLLPNLLPGGLMRIEAFDGNTGQSTAVYTRQDGFWEPFAETVNPDGGLGFPLALVLEEPDGEGLFGDVNGDGVVNAVDVQLVINAALGGELDPAYNPDINGDRIINAVDVQLVINAALGVRK